MEGMTRKDLLVAGAAGVAATSVVGNALASPTAAEGPTLPRSSEKFHFRVGTADAVIPITFGNNDPDDVGLSTMFGGMPTSTFEETLGLKKGALAGARKPDKTLFIVD